jgi:ABC-type transport system involved in multi-copper enzyme maturation permease subunit
MTWLTWRQFRAQAITAVAALALFAILLAVTKSHMSSLYEASGLTGCHGGTCTGPANTFLNQLASGRGVPFLPTGANAYVILYFLSVVVILVAPAIVGMFWGAPLIARELETGTCRLAWSQSITRTRWLTVKLALLGVAAMVVTEAFSLLQAWWAAPIGKAVGLGGSASIFTEGRYGLFVFPTHGITPLGYAVFAFALGVTTGLLIRRPIPAMAVTLAIFGVVQFVIPLWIRPHLVPSSRTIATIKAAGANVYALGRVTMAGSAGAVSHFTMAGSAGAVPGQPGAWILSSGFADTAGRSVSTVPRACESAIQAVQGPRNPVRLNNCLTSHGIRVTESYQPLSHYWPLQWAETGLFLALALALAGFCFWRLGRRRT